MFSTELSVEIKMDKLKENTMENFNTAVATSPQLAEALFSIFNQWKTSFKRKDIFQRALELAVASLLCLGKKTITSMAIFLKRSSTIVFGNLKLLNVSRPFLIKLLDEGKIPFHKVGTHRRIRFIDLLNFKAYAGKISQKALDELVQQAQELDMGY